MTDRNGHSPSLPMNSIHVKAVSTVLRLRALGEEPPRRPCPKGTTFFRIGDIGTLVCNDDHVRARAHACSCQRAPPQATRHDTPTPDPDPMAQIG